VHPSIWSIDRYGICNRGLDATATTERSPAIVDAAHKFLLKCVTYMVGVCERGTARSREQLKGRLAVTVFEVLEAELTPINAQKTITPRRGDQRDGLSRIAWSVLYSEPHRGLIRQGHEDRDIEQ